jgi:Zn-dependent protease with chaperone function
MIDAIYFDERSTRRQPVTVVFHKGVIALRGTGLHRSVRLSKLRISERLENAPRLAYFPDGGFIEFSDPALERMLAANGYREPWVVRWQQNWPLALLALIALLMVLITGYQWGLPWAADTIAQRVPPSFEQKIGDESLKMMDRSYMEPSKLSAVDQARLRKLFSDMKQPRGEKTPYRLEFRSSMAGPNAFALPNGVIVMTDELVALAANEQAVLGVLSHELGHVQRRHSLRRLMQAVGTGMAINMLIGDVSGVLATLPTLLLDRSYSREFEREADQYAIDMMRVNHIPLSPMAELFEKIGTMRNKPARNAENGDDEDGTHDHEEDWENDDGDDNDDGTSRPGEKNSKRNKTFDYLSSHPSDEERIAKLRAADRNK